MQCSHMTASESIANAGLWGCGRGALLLQLLDSYAVRYSEMLDGRSEHLPVNELAGGARIRHIFLDIFVNGLQELNPSKCATCSLQLCQKCLSAPIQLYLFC